MTVALESLAATGIILGAPYLFIRFRSRRRFYFLGVGGLVVVVMVAASICAG